MEPSTSLSFYGTITAPIAVVGALFEKHQSVTDGWLPFEDFVGTDGSTSLSPLSQRIAHRLGILARGPVSLLESYREVLVDHSVSASLVLPYHHPRRWIAGIGWIADTSNLSVCVLGETYIVAEAFVFREIDAL